MLMCEWTLVAMISVIKQMKTGPIQLITSMPDPSSICFKLLLRHCNTLWWWSVNLKNAKLTVQLAGFDED